VPLVVRRIAARPQRIGTVCHFTTYADQLLPDVIEEPGDITINSYDTPLTVVTADGTHHALRPLSENKGRLAQAFQVRMDGNKEQLTEPFNTCAAQALPDCHIQLKSSNHVLPLNLWATLLTI
jgi:hypothetical protein